MATAPAPGWPAPPAVAGGRPVSGVLVAVRLAVLLVLAVALGAVHLPGRPRTLCLLRATTGMPCPFCGSTTAAVAVGRGDLVTALRASPLAVLGAPVVAALPVLRHHLDRVPSVARRVALVALLAGSELWQLTRVGRG